MLIFKKKQANKKSFLQTQSGEECWRSTKFELLEFQCDVSTVSADLWSRVTCWYWSNVFYQVRAAVWENTLQHVPLLTGFKETLTSFSRRGMDSHTAKSPSNHFNHYIIAALDCPGNSPGR